MNRFLLLPVLALLAGSCATVRTSPSAATENPDAIDQYRKLQTLAGEWVTVGGNDQARGTRIVYRPTAGASTMMETMSPGTDYEMISMYALDNGQLEMTHYCMLQNQPHMRAVPSDDPNVIVFECTGEGGNITSEDQPHMHRAEFRFEDADHVTTYWTNKAGENEVVMEFGLQRQP